MAAQGIDDLPVGTLVRTPTGRIGMVVKHIWGADGDLPRCLVAYLDADNRRDLVRLRPDCLEAVSKAKTLSFLAKKYLKL